MTQSYAAARLLSTYVHEDGVECTPNEDFAGFAVPCSSCGAELRFALNATVDTDRYQGSGIRCGACGASWRLYQTPGRSTLRTYVYQLAPVAMETLYGTRLRGLAGRLVAR